MRTRLNKTAGLLLGSILLLCTGFTSSTPVSAQYRNDNQDRRGRNWDGYPNWGGSFELRQTALNAGFNEGSKEGRKDHTSSRSSSYQNSSAYQKATKDYNSRLGSRELYRRYFREGFQSGYNTELGVQVTRDRNDRDWNRDRDGNNQRDQNRRGRNWDRYGNYGGTYQLRQTALNAGYNQGIKEGRDDRRQGKFTDFRSFSAYQKATQDHNSRLGDRELYRHYYRDGFENGYSDGYNGG